MISAILQILSVVIVIPFLLIAAVFLRAVTAKCTTGKWPHENELSQKIYRRFPAMTYDELVVRLTLLEAPDREVDAQIYIQFFIPTERAGRIDYENGMVGWWPKDGPYVSAVTVPAYTASVDAAIALAERVLPGWGWLVQNCGQPAGVLVKDDDAYEGIGSTPAIALCVAILSARDAILAASPLGEKKG